jgi:serine/threonine-protein kinase
MRGKQGDSGRPESADELASESEAESWLRKAVAAPVVRNPTPQVGQLIGGKYLIQAELGRGGMGAVFRAVHAVSGRALALKWMLRSGEDDQARERFKREARAAGRIDHPNVVDVYDIGEEGDATYLVMELLRGESLRTRLARGPSSPAETVAMLVPAMRGVAAAHREGVIHRDLKPDNIFLCCGPGGEAREAKVLDFGVSSIRTTEDAQTTLTREGTVLGTPAYMSPEQLHSAHNLDERTDVYAFGVILYEALTGRVPFQGTSYSALVLAIVNTTPRSLREIRPEIPEALERVVLQALARDREQRIPSIDALIALLEPSTAGEPALHSSAPETTPPSVAFAHTSPALPVTPSEPPASRRRPARRALIVATLASLAALAWWLGWSEPLRQPSANAGPRTAPTNPGPASPPALPEPPQPAAPDPVPTPSAAPSAPEPAQKPPARKRASPIVDRPAASSPERADNPHAPARAGPIKLDEL